MAELELRLLSSLDKVFWDGCDCPHLVEEDVMLENEQYAFQAAFCYRDEKNPSRVFGSCALEGMEGELRQVESVPSRLAAVPEQLDAIRREPGWYPDVLADGEQIRVLPGQWGSVWVTIPGGAPGERTVSVTLTVGEISRTARLRLRVLPERLPAQKLIFTQWLHWDCIARQHRTEMFSERFWELLEAYVKTAADYGINMLLTPIFTPPLDTAVGGSRMPCQLVDVREEPEGGWRFGFDRLKRWTGLCRRHGIERFELSHLFTQWGAKATPAIWAETREGRKQIFGWHVPSDDGGYAAFLRAFLAELDGFLRREGLADRCVLHISDEPGNGAMELYCRTAALVAEAMPGYPIMDAMSDYEIYRRSGIRIPVAALDEIETFVEKDVRPLWGYYCWVQYRGVSNRFMSMPSLSTRILGVQAWLYRLEGFLHWGLNFYNSQLSLGSIDPYAVTDADGTFPSGDAFSVYPVEDGCVPSLRMAVFREGLQDLRALELLEEKLGRTAVEAIIREELGRVTFQEWPRDTERFLRFRRRVCRELGEA